MSYHTIASIRHAIRDNEKIDNLKAAVVFLLKEYDSLWRLRKTKASMKEYNIIYTEEKLS